MTYLQLVNKVLRRLREATVASTTDTNYSTLISELVNQAKAEVEDAHTWLSLKTTVNVVTAGDGSTYTATLAGTNERTKLLGDSVWDVTNQVFVPVVNWERVDFWRSINQNDIAGTLAYIADYGVSSGLKRLAFHQVPTSATTLKVRVYIPQDDLASDSDILAVPSLPVWLRAYALAISERGEDGGAMWNEIDQSATDALNDAISRDYDHRQNELIWRPM